MNTLNFVRKIVDGLQGKNDWVECDINDLRDFICISCWSKEQAGEVYRAMFSDKEGAKRYYSMVQHPTLESHMILVAKGIGNK